MFELMSWLSRTTSGLCAIGTLVWLVLLPVSCQLPKEREVDSIGERVSGSQVEQVATLVRLQSRGPRDGEHYMEAEEFKRGEKVSWIRVHYKSTLPSVGFAMFIARAQFMIAKERGSRFFVELERVDRGPRCMEIAIGYSMTEPINVSAEFGQQYSADDSTGTPRHVWNVRELESVFQMMAEAWEEETGEVSSWK